MVFRGHTPKGIYKMSTFLVHTLYPQSNVCVTEPNTHHRDLIGLFIDNVSCTDPDPNLVLEFPLTRVCKDTVPKVNNTWIGIINIPRQHTALSVSESDSGNRNCGVLIEGLDHNHSVTDGYVSVTCPQECVAP